MNNDKRKALNDQTGLTAFAIKNKVTVFIIVALLAFSGISSYFGLPKQQDPGFTIRSVVISTQFPGI